MRNIFRIKIIYTGLSSLDTIEDESIYYILPSVAS